MSYKKIMPILMLMLCVSYAYAIDKPDHPEDPFKSGDFLAILGGSEDLPSLSITPLENTIMGSKCSNMYATTGEYCSGHLRIYYQCLPTMDGGEWQQRSENCEDYGGRCIQEDGKAKCVDYPGSTGFGKALLVWGVVLIVVGLAAGFAIHPIFFIFTVLGIWLLIKFFLGGV